jgi:hypothetical protein
MSSAKTRLTKRLADLLGFADGAEDVLEHLLSIESSEVRLGGSLPRIAMYSMHLKNQHALLLRISRTIYLNF